MFEHPRDSILYEEFGEARGRAAAAVMDERHFQEAEFSAEQDDLLTPPEWIARIVKHVGRAVTLDHLAFRRAMVVVGAIALAAIEWHDRRYEP